MTILSAQGASGSGTLTVDDTTVMITAPGSGSIRLKPPSEQRILLVSIGAVQWRHATRLANGYIQFTVADAPRDGNVVLFGREHQPEFELIRAHVEARLGWSPTESPAAYAVEELTGLARRHHQGLLTAEEFAAQKATLMSGVGLKTAPAEPAWEPEPSGGTAAPEPDLENSHQQSDRLRQVLRAVSGSMDADDDCIPEPREAAESGSRQNGARERLARAGMWFRF